MTGSFLSFSVGANEIPAEGKRFQFEADEEDRRTLAATLGILDLQTLSADLQVRPSAGRTIGVRGSVSAAVLQTDVITLAPVRQELLEEIDVTLVPAEAAAPRREREAAVAEIEDADQPDLYRNGRIELGALAAEHLALGLDPYPRAPGVQFEGHAEDAATEDSSAFAALAKLKREGE